MIDVGRKSSSLTVQPMASGKNKKHYPSLYLDVVPEEIMSKDVGSTCRLEIIGEVVSKSINDENGGTRESMTIEVKKIGYIGNAENKNSEEYLKMSDEEREEYDDKEFEEK